MKRVVMILMVLMMLVGCGTTAASPKNQVEFKKDALLRFRDESTYGTKYDVDIKINDIKFLEHYKVESGEEAYIFEASYVVTNYGEELLDPSQISLTHLVSTIKGGNQAYQDKFLPKADMPSLRKGESANCTQVILLPEPKGELNLVIYDTFTKEKTEFVLKQ